MSKQNPFSLIRASEFSDELINSLWVSRDGAIAIKVLEPVDGVSKFILGGKGSGKTHLLRYHSYPALRLRSGKRPGLDLVKDAGFIGIFIRATGLDSLRFEIEGVSARAMQNLFGIYLELRLAELVLDVLVDVRNTSPGADFQDESFVRHMASSQLDPSLSEANNLVDFRNWILDQRRKIDSAVNEYAFGGGELLRLPFSLGSLSLELGRGLAEWQPRLANVPLLYMVDEIENLSVGQQEVLNTLIRYSEGRASFRLTGRLYSIKTLKTIGEGEENREGSEFRKIVLDDVLRDYQGYPEFARRLVFSRVHAGDTASGLDLSGSGFNPDLALEALSSKLFFKEVVEQFELVNSRKAFLQKFETILSDSLPESVGTQAILLALSDENFPLILQKLNILLFSKRFRGSVDPIELARSISMQCIRHLDGSAAESEYSTAYGHYSGDLLAQLFRDARKHIGIPYAGFDTFVRMSCGNPRNLLLLLGRAYEISAFRGQPLLLGKVSIPLQTEAASETARFTFEVDTNFGAKADIARRAVERLASVLRAARYSLRIPEVGPLSVSFSDEDLTPGAREAICSSLNYSMIYEVHGGRPDRNTGQLKRKIQLNPMLSPRWGLPISRRGDISLSPEISNAIFDGSQTQAFGMILRRLDAKWNSLRRVEGFQEQAGLF